MREWGKRSFCLVCMFLVLTGMPVTVQATDYDGGTGSAEKTQETYLKTFLEVQWSRRIEQKERERDESGDERICKKTGGTDDVGGEDQPDAL